MRRSRGKSAPRPEQRIDESGGPSQRAGSGDLDPVDLLERFLGRVFSRPGFCEDAELSPTPAALPHAASEGGISEDQYGPAVSRAMELAHGCLARFRALRTEDADIVARLLAQQPRERWARIATDEALWRPELVDLLLEVARPLESAHGDDEEVSLLALHLAERLDPGAFPSGLVADLHSRALALRIEHHLHGRRLRAAELASLRCRELVLESTDPLVAFETGLAVALLSWAKGRGGPTLKLLLDLCRLAAAFGELEKAAEMALWSHLLLEALGDNELAAYQKDWAERLLTSALLEHRLEAVRAHHEWLHLGESAPTWAEERRTVH